MKALIINGSPRPKGNTSYIIEKLNEKLNCDADIINSYYLDFTSCIDCRKCITTEKCIYNDKITDVIDKINDYDIVVFASPLYFNQPTGSLLSLSSRFQFLYNTGANLKPKKGIIILTGGGDSVVNSEDAEKTMRIIMRGLGVNEFFYIRSLHTTSLSAQEDNTIEEQILNCLNKKTDLSNALF